MVALVVRILGPGSVLVDPALREQLAELPPMAVPPVIRDQVVPTGLFVLCDPVNARGAIQVDVVALASGELLLRDVPGPLGVGSRYGVSRARC